MSDKTRTEIDLEQLSKLKVGKEYKTADYPQVLLSRIRLDLAAGYGIAVTMPTPRVSRGSFVLSKIS